MSQEGYPKWLYALAGINFGLAISWSIVRSELGEPMFSVPADGTLPEKLDSLSDELLDIAWGTLLVSMFVSEWLQSRKKKKN